MENNNETKLRIRIGVLFIILWWIPFWLVSGIIISADDIHKAQHRREVLILTIIVQSILGLIGAFLIGKSMVKHMRHQKFRRFPVIAWRLFKTGTVEN